MTRNLQIEKEIEAALGSLDHLTLARPSPFFYTRLSARLSTEEESVWGRLSRTIARPAIAGLSILVIVVANVLVVLTHDLEATQKPEQAEIAVADEYNRTVMLYNIDNVQP